MGPRGLLLACLFVYAAMPYVIGRRVEQQSDGTHTMVAPRTEALPVKLSTTHAADLGPEVMAWTGDASADPALGTLFGADSQVALRAATPPPTSAAFDPERAQLMARIQSIAYCSDQDAVAVWNCTRCQAIPDFQPYISYFDEAWDLYGFAGYLPSLRAKFVVFRGTDSSSWYNWAQNMRAWRTDATYPVPGAPRALRLHSGFLLLWNASSLSSTFSAVYQKMAADHPDGPTYVLGHSMGGALAQLAAMDFTTKFGARDVRVYTFGSPRVGNSVFASFLLDNVAESWRFTHGHDIVPSVPMTVLGFHHAAREVWLVDIDGRQQRSLQRQGGRGTEGVPEVVESLSTHVELDERLVVCDETGEDPSCHNSACRLGLCTSVADHLQYLGIHMYSGGEC